jgi:hypothetical protein
MESIVQIGGHSAGLGTTTRKDRWWVGPAITAFGFLSFIIYTTWAGIQGKYYFAGSYLSPMYSPLLFVDPTAPGSAPLAHAWFGLKPEWWPTGLRFSPAFFILVFPGAFRVTCYYYRKAYYRSMFGTPPGCAVGPVSQKKYKGETRLLLWQNLHRYALYFAIAYIFILYYDAFASLVREGEWGIGVGSVVLFVNATLLGTYTFGCHSFRHLIGGRLDCFSCNSRAQMRHAGWKRVSWLNARHQLFAWVSLIFVGFTDVYVRLVSMGIITDLNTWGS